jgi:hypothetical protein
MLDKVATVEICYVPRVTNSRYVLGLGFILLQCCVWVAASVLTQYMFEETSVESPFLMTYVGVALMTLMFPLRWMKDRLWYDPDVAAHVSEADSFDEAIAKANAYGDILEVMTTRSRAHAQSKKQWNHKKHALAALQ